MSLTIVKDLGTQLLLRFPDGAAGYAVTVAKYEQLRRESVAAQAQLHYTHQLDSVQLYDESSDAGKVRKELGGGAGAPILLVKYKEQQLATVADPASIPYEQRRLLLFQYVFALHEVYAKLGSVVADAATWSIEQLPQSSTPVYSIKRMNGSWDVFTTPTAMDYQLRLEYGDFSRTTTMAGINYAPFCNALFPQDQELANRPDMRKAIFFLKAGDWAARSGYNWGPCMMLFHPAFADFKPVAQPIASLGGPTAPNYRRATPAATDAPELRLADLEPQAQAVEAQAKALLQQPAAPAAPAGNVYAARRAALKADVVELINTYENITVAAQDEAEAATTIIKGAYRRLQDVYGVTEPIISEQSDAVLSSAGWVDGGDIYVKKSKLVPGALSFFAYTGRTPLSYNYNASIERIKNGAWIVLELIARAAVDPTKDNTRPSVADLADVVANPAKLDHQDQQEERIEFLLQQFDEDEVKRRATKAEAERKANEAARAAQQEALRLAQEEAARKVKEAEDRRKAKEEADRLAREAEAARKAAKEAADRLASPKLTDLAPLVPGLGLFDSGQTFYEAFAAFKATAAASAKYGTTAATAAELEARLGNDPYRMAGLLHAWRGQQDGDGRAIVRGLSMANIV